MSPRRTLSFVFRVCLSVFVGGCALGPAPRGAQDVIAAYAGALERGDAPRAYALLTEEERRALSEADYTRLFRQRAREAQELAAWLARSEAPKIVATVRLEDGSIVELERGPAGFRVVDPLVRFYAQRSPREALCTFVRAVERSRWDLLLALMPSADAEGLSATTLAARLAGRKEELTRLSALLWASRNQPIEIVGQRATMPYGESYTARFVRENGLWKLEDPD